MILPVQYKIYYILRCLSLFLNVFSVYYVNVGLNAPLMRGKRTRRHDNHKAEKGLNAPLMRGKRTDLMTEYETAQGLNAPLMRGKRTR